MNPTRNSDNSGNTFILIIILVIILGIILFLVFKFKPNTKEFNTVKGEIKSTSQEHIEEIETSIRKIYNLTNEASLFEELFDELVYAESPGSDQIADFVSNYHDFAAEYSEDIDKYKTSDLFSKDYDSTILSSDRQQKFLESSIVSLLQSIDNKKKILVSIPVSCPVEKKDGQIISGFGMREHPILNEPRMHTGIDIKAPVGTAIVATASGKVINTEEQIGYGYGRPCVIEHKYGYRTIYGHMVRLEVYKNKIVQKGDVIGRVGDTGLSQGPHLHYEVRKNGKPLNPSHFIFEDLTGEEYKEVIKLGTQ